MSNGYNHSLVIRIDFGSASRLITGELEMQALDKLTAIYCGSGLLNYRFNRC